MKSLIVGGEFLDCLGEIKVNQRWVNSFDKTITTNYTFALDSNAVVSGFQMKIGQKYWSGVVKEKGKANSEFKEAVNSGIKSCVLNKRSDNSYQVEIGPIDPSESLEVEFR